MRLSVASVLAALFVSGSLLAAGQQFDSNDPWDWNTDARLKHVREQGGGSGSSYGFQIRGIVGQAEHELDGFFSYADAGQPGTRVDVKNDLGMEKEKTERFAGVFQFGILRLGGSYQKFDLSGSGTVPFNIQFGGITFSSSAQVDTTVKTSLYTADLGFRLYRNSLFELGIGLGVHYYDMVFTMSGTEALTNISRTEQKELQAPVPVAMAWGSVFVGPFSIDPKIEIMQSPRISGIKGTTYDLSLGARWHLLPTLAVGAEVGYALMDIEAEDDGTTSDNFSGELDLTSTRLSIVVGFSF